MVLPLFVHETLADVLNSRMYAEHSFAAFAASVQNQEQRSRKLLVSYRRVVSYLLKTFATDQAVAEFDSLILRYMRPSSIAPRRYADRIMAKMCKAAEVYDKSTLSAIYVDGVDSSIRRSVRTYRATLPQAYLIDIEFWAELLLTLQNESGSPSPSNQKGSRSEKRYTFIPCNNCSSINNVNKDTTNCPTHSLRRRSTSLSVNHFSPPCAQISYHNSIPSFSSAMLLMSSSHCEICYGPTHVTTI